jgi:hypothetical protein
MILSAPRFAAINELALVVIGQRDVLGRAEGLERIRPACVLM